MVYGGRLHDKRFNNRARSMGEALMAKDLIWHDGIWWTPVEPLLIQLIDHGFRIPPKDSP